MRNTRQLAGENDPVQGKEVQAGVLGPPEFKLKHTIFRFHVREEIVGG